MSYFARELKYLVVAGLCCSSARFSRRSRSCHNERSMAFNASLSSGKLFTEISLVGTLV